MSTELRIREAAPADAELVLAMVREIADHQDQGEHVTITADRWRELLARPEVTVLIAERDGAALGYVSAVRRLHLWSGGDVIGLDDLYVREAARDLGVGKALMLELSRLAQPEQLTIAWGVEPHNEGAIRFYDRLGAYLRNKVVVSWPASQRPS
ncbi:GNAT family N-acetyltransferase [Nocardioides speluncae]|uniref:GNAT family N-acetyltransferase n=1 Tax=Nocardioides speluncae TaxID=2670337 RepID=UPI000D68647B|nr:GNAT family N-acetyltransferase [Nocardioides speluncae]